MTDRGILKIAMLGQKTVPAMGEDRGWVEAVVEELSLRMAALGHFVSCYNRAGCDNGGLKEYKRVHLKKVFTIRAKGLAAVTSSLSAAVCASLGNYDIVHFHAEGPCFFLWIPKLFRKRCIATIHGLDWQREKWAGGFGSLYIRWGEKIAVRYADEIIVQSKNVQDYFRYTYARKTVLIPNGVIRPNLRKADEILKRYGLDKNSYILFMGSLVPEKGLGCLLEAFSDLDTDKKLVIAGENFDSVEFSEKMQRLCTDDARVIFTGTVGGRLKEELYSNACLYCLSSELEGMPLSLLEAMSYGNTCLVSDIPECREVVEDQVIIFKRGDAEDLREKLQLLLGDEQMREKCREAVSDYICGKYDWDQVCEETLKVYRRENSKNFDGQ